MAAQATKADIEALDRKLVAKLDATSDELRQELHATREGLETKIRANGIMLERLDAKVDAITLKCLKSPDSGNIWRQSDRRC